MKFRKLLAIFGLGTSSKIAMAYRWDRPFAEKSDKIAMAYRWDRPFAEKSDKIAMAYRHDQPFATT